MNHVAIMKKSWGLLPKIVSGEKKIESRWYKNKSAPWGKIKRGDVIYFKNSGEEVSVKTSVDKVLEFENLNQAKVRQILNKYGKDDGIAKKDLPRFFKLFRDKKYCLLIFLKNPRKIKPFDITKKGFGTMSAWLCVGSINKIKV
jgi:ASC-1-like (ASCH) protein